MKLSSHDYPNSTSQAFDLHRAANLHQNLGTARLYEHALRRGEGALSTHGSLIIATGRYTGRSPGDKFIVQDAVAKDVAWGEVNQPLSEAHFLALKEDFQRYLAGKDLYVQDLLLGADPRYQVPARIITEYAWHNLFARTLLIPPVGSVPVPVYTVISLPDFEADPKRHGTRSSTVIALHLGLKQVLIGGTQYAGEIKKSLFSVMNFELPSQGVLPMHCSANHDREGNVALFFGLSGTGKTTLSTDNERFLIGDDEHGWSEEGIFNFEGGCYAKVINLNVEAEPEIYALTGQFGTLLENVGFDAESREVDFFDDSKTENTRAAYALEQLPQANPDGVGAHPKTIIFLTADAFGVLPPISKLTPAGATYHFLSGYTAKVAGTERGVTEPKATFSTCFGAPFMPLRPSVYAELFSEKIHQHGTTVWLVNTGWTGGPYGVGTRMKLTYTRAMVRAALTGELDKMPTRLENPFHLAVPQHCPNVPDEVLNARGTWQDSDAYDVQANRLAAMFRENFRQFASHVSAEVRASAPG